MKMHSNIYSIQLILSKLILYTLVSAGMWNLLIKICIYPRRWEKLLVR